MQREEEKGRREAVGVSTGRELSMISERYEPVSQYVPVEAEQIPLAPVQEIVQDRPPLSHEQMLELEVGLCQREIQDLQLQVKQMEIRESGHLKRIALLNKKIEKQAATLRQHAENEELHISGKKVKAFTMSLGNKSTQNTQGASQAHSIRPATFQYVEQNELRVQDAYPIPR
jgi:hypothetical protein